MLTVSRNNIVSVDTPNRDEFFKNVLSDESKQNILGRGSYGTVVKAVYRDQQVAVKIIDSRSQIKMWSFKNESNILGWQHENIIKILKIVSTSTYSIIIMERFPGQCLQFILDNVVIPVVHRICISIDLSNALIYCHDRGLIHLDIKPQNVIVAYLDSWRIETICSSSSSSSSSTLYASSKLYICKLCDFGSSLKIEQKLDDSPTNRGTVRYMSPEALKRTNITTSSDIYSFGITMWQLKTRIYPYSSIESNDIVAYRVVKENLRPDHDFPFNNNNNKIFLTPTNTHTNCICEHFSSDLSKNSVENLQKILKSSNSLESSLKLFQHLNNDNTNKRIPFMNLNKKLNIQSCSSTQYNHKDKFNNSIKQSTTVTKNLQNKNLSNHVKVSIKITTENENNEKFINIDSTNASNMINIEHNSNNENNHLSPNTINRLSSSSSISDFKNIFHNIQFHYYENQQKFIYTTNLTKSYKIQIENDYEILYKNCWNKYFEQRPNALEIKSTLQNILIEIFNFKRSNQ